MFRRVRQAVAGDPDRAESRHVAVTLADVFRVGQPGVCAAHEHFHRPCDPRAAFDLARELEALLQRFAGAGQRRARAAGHARRHDLVLEVHAEQGGLVAEPGARRRPQAQFVVPGQLSVQVDAAARGRDDVGDPWGREAAVHSGKHDRLGQDLEGRADAWYPFVDAAGARRAEQVVDALIVDALEAQARCHRPAAKVEAVLHEGGQRIHRAVAVFPDAGVAAGARLARGRQVAIRLHPVLVLDVVTQAEFGHVVHAKESVLDRGARFQPGGPVLAQTSLVAAGRQQVGHAATGGIAGIVRALAGVAGLPPPVAAEVRVIDVGGEGHGRVQVEAVRRRRAQALRIHVVIAERVLVRIVLPLRQRQARVRHLRRLIVKIATHRHGLAFADPLHDLQVEVGHVEVHVVAGAVGRLVHAMRDEPGVAERVAHLAMEFAETVVAHGPDQSAVEIRRHGWRDVVDDRADRVRAVGDLARTLEHLDALEPFHRRVVVGRVVTIGCIGQGNAILEQQHLARARRIEAAHAQVGPQTQAFLVAREDSGHLAQGLVDREHPRCGQDLAADDVGAAGNRVEPDPVADHDDDRLEAAAVRGDCVVVGDGRLRGTEQRGCNGHAKQGRGAAGSGRTDSGLVVHGGLVQGSASMGATVPNSRPLVNANHSYLR